MSAVDAVPAPELVTMEITSPARHLCPFVDEVDEGTVSIRWRTAGKTLELHSLRRYLDAYAETHISHEALTALIRAHLNDIDGINVLDVTTNWDTAGMEVACSTSQIPAGRPL